MAKCDTCGPQARALYDRQTELLDTLVATLRELETFSPNDMPFVDDGEIIVSSVGKVRVSGFRWTLVVNPGLPPGHLCSSV